MAITHVNRKGRTYYLHRGQTKTGKDKYYVSAKSDGILAGQLPEGFEIYENPDAQVYLRRKIVTLLHDEEVRLVEAAIASKAGLKPYQYKIELGKEILTIHLLDEHPQEFIATFFPLKGRNYQSLEEIANHYGIYTAMLRFILVDAEKRQFGAERFCFLGSIDDWIYLAGPDKLKTIAGKLIGHLGKESFFDLM